MPYDKRTQTGVLTSPKSTRACEDISLFSCFPLPRGGFLSTSNKSSRQRYISLSRNWFTNRPPGRFVNHHLTRDQAPSGGFFEAGNRFSCPVFGLRPKTNLKKASPHFQGTRVRWIPGLRRRTANTLKNLLKELTTRDYREGRRPLKEVYPLL